MSGLAFDPAAHGFVELVDYKPPWGVRYYEFKNHDVVDGRHDFHRLNYYLTQDGEFVTAWMGTLETAILDVLFADSETEAPDYNEPLFRGHIDSQSQGAEILRALRLHTQSPQVLQKEEDGQIVCEALVKL